jgi:alpha-L-arabinofuranosidase
MKYAGSAIVVLLSLLVPAALGQDADRSHAPLLVTIDTEKTGPEINPFIYGQFIEHLGRCVYGGIWAEMLEDRKFYFEVSEEYRPYRALTDSEFPVVGASPWEVSGPAGSVTMVTERPFVGEHSPRIETGSGIRQNDLAVLAGKKYVGNIWLRAVGSVANVTVSLVWGDAPEERQSVTMPIEGDEFAQYPLEFTVGVSTNSARLAIEVADAPCEVGAVSLMPGDHVRGFRADTLALLKELNATMYRWPGGNFVSGYDWRDGIGPRDKRPPRRNPAWTGVEHNDVGVEEFLDFCGEVGAEPMITVNTGFGDDYSAAQQVEYTNGSIETIGGTWRVRDGRAESYDVKYWCVGNEMFGDWQLGHMSLAHYTQKHNLVAKAMKKVDPTLKLVAVGNYTTESKENWSEEMLRACHDHMDYISEHFYKGRTPWGEKPPEDVGAYASLLKDEIRRRAEGHRKMQGSLALLPDERVPIAMDEWNYWHTEYEYGELGCVYELRDALGVAAGLHEYFRNSDMIQMAHYAQTVNVIGCIKTTKTEAFLDTTALPLLLYRREFGSVPLDVKLKEESDTVDVMAAKTGDGKTLTVGVVNAGSEPQMLELHVAGAETASTADVWRIAGEDPRATNSPKNQQVKIVEERDVEFSETMTVPAYSVSLYRVPIE